MDRTDALLFQLRVQVLALARALVRPGADARALWRMADAVLDTHDAADAARLDLRAEVHTLMSAIARRRHFDAEGVSARLAEHARALASPDPALACG
jgi:hypothetical protein